MPIPAGIVLGGLAAQTVGNLYSSYKDRESQRDTNKESLKYDLDMYNESWRRNYGMYQEERNNSLKDWAMQNEYNSPKNQMARLKEAGLNPQMVYNQGYNAPPVHSATASAPEYKSYQPGVPRYKENIDIGASLGGYYDASLKTAQTDNVKANTEVAKQEALLKAVQTLNTAQQTKVSQFDLGVKQDTRHVTVEAAKANLERMWTDIAKTTTDTNINIQRNDREQGAYEQNSRLRSIQIMLKSQGISENDPLYIKMMALAVKNPKLNAAAIGEKVQELFHPIKIK